MGLYRWTSIMLHEYGIYTEFWLACTRSTTSSLPSPIRRVCLDDTACLLHRLDVLIHQPDRQSKAYQVVNR